MQESDEKEESEYNRGEPRCRESHLIGREEMAGEGHRDEYSSRPNPAREENEALESADKEASC